MPPLQYSNLLRELEEHNVFFDTLVDMIPAKLYVAGNSGDDKYNSKYFKGQHKESKEARRARNKAAKRIKFDPERAETTNQAKERLAKEEENKDDDDDEDMEELVEDTPAPKSSGKKKQKEAPSTPDQPTAPPSTTDGPTSSTSRIEALRSKLHAKLAEKRAGRPSDPNAVSKRAARRSEKQKRQEDAKKRKATTKVGRGENTQQYTIGSASAAAATKESDLANLDFGKLAGLNSTLKNFANNKSLANVNKKKNLQKMLLDAEEKKKKLEELKRSSEDGDKAKVVQLAWSDALKEASGERIKDDPNKLRKALKRKMAKKEKSTKAWKSRMEQTKGQMDERQKIRTHNLDKRKQGGASGANLSSKKIADEEKEEEKSSRRMSRPGFEGKKQGFLNQGKKGSSQ
mmetsp:Transcript_20100/g.33345  ORF Transcript_20100/g.33345 Transcript_20100/m.33345 type:complete len:402 (+) Transcript_20100:75-1280(+)